MKLEEEPLSTAKPQTGVVVELSQTVARASEAERRQLTVLFCDLVESTTLAAHLDPQRVSGLGFRAGRAHFAHAVLLNQSHLGKRLSFAALLIGSWSPDLVTKSGIILGLGEERGELIDTMRDLVGVGVRILTLGQYLRPSPSHLPVVRYYPPEEFAELAALGRALGFAHVEAGPLVRSSYHAKKQSDSMNGRDERSQYDSINREDQRSQAVSGYRPPTSVAAPGHSLQ